jgi:signal transduction histidine kinase
VSASNLAGLAEAPTERAVPDFTSAIPRRRGDRFLVAGMLLCVPVFALALINAQWVLASTIAAVAGGLLAVRQAILLRERTSALDEVRRLHSENDRLVEELRRELDERALVQRRMIQASRATAVGELASGVAHEVNNPLTGVLGFAELLLDDLGPDDPRRADVETIRTEAMRARAIVRALRDFANPAEPSMVSLDLADVVRRTVDLVRYPLVRRGVEIVETYDELPSVEGDAQAIQQALLNVLTNASQAIPDKGRLAIEVTSRDREAVITITDDGIGMDDETLDQAFEPFFSARRSGTGAGLGLSVSRGLIESHGGTIQLTSLPAVGTTVELRLPLLD